MPTFIKETFPDAGATDTLDDLSSTEVDVPGYGGGGGSLSTQKNVNHMSIIWCTMSCGL